ncbi:MAG TPA: RuBisCO large subunit C-terminal-like domain-containing protein [Armatimonadota bacterium]
MILAPNIREALSTDLDSRAALIRQVVVEQLQERGPVTSPEHVVGAYFVMSRTSTVAEVGETISYHMTSGVHHPPVGSLLEACTGQVLAAEPFDASGRVGLVWVGFPVRMMQYPDGRVYTTDLLHLMAGEGVVGLCDHADIQLVDLTIPETVLATFPGPAYGAPGVRAVTGFPAGTPIFGTILKPCSGITPEEVGALVREAAGNPLFGFVKEDENLVPGASFCPLADRTREAVTAVREQMGRRGGRGILFAPHITAQPDLLMRHLEVALEAGVNAVMFSDQFAGGTTRMVREFTREMAQPPAIYAHNSGISNKTRSIWREVLDLLVRLDGADFRQTAPLTTTAPLLRPNGQEWLRCEEALTRPLGPIKPTMIARAGGLDQGNIILNLHDAAQRGYGDAILYLAGSAINSIKDAQGRPAPELGSAAMREAVEAYTSGAVSAEAPDRHVAALYAYAVTQGKTALRTALVQRYPAMANA